MADEHNKLEALRSAVPALSGAGSSRVLPGMAGMLVAAVVLAAGIWLPGSDPSMAHLEPAPLVKAAKDLAAAEYEPEAVVTLEEKRALASSAPRPEKLANAQETIDDNAVVHGTLNGVNYTVRGRGMKAAQDNKVTLAAVGDQLASDGALAMADANAGEVGDGAYDFNPWYREVGPFICEQDLRFINQETVMIDTGEYGYAGYPSFNTPGTAAQAIANQGFNVVNFTTNHSYDYDKLGIERSHEVWAQYPQLLIGGSFLSKQDRETVQMIERNGQTFAFLHYTYGDNRFDSIDQFPNTYYSCGFDYALAEADIKRAKQVADCVKVVMHWGTEYTPEPDSNQREWSQWLADQDVDLVLGTHAHTIQPVEYVEGKTGNKVLVVFGLSDFVSGWDVTAPIISGIFTCDMVRDEQTGRISHQNPVWHSTIEWSDGKESNYVRLLANMSKEETNANIHTPDIEDDYVYTRTLTNEIITQIPVDWGDSELVDAAASEPGEAQSSEETEVSEEGQASEEAQALEEQPEEQPEEDNAESTEQE